MNVLSAMAGISDGEFCKKFAKDNVDIITLGGFNIDLESFKAGLEVMAKGRKEFFTCPHHLSEDVTEFVQTIHDHNPSWNGKISANLRGTSVKSFNVLYENENVDILEINAHCRQEKMVEAGTGEAILKNKKFLNELMEEVTTNSGKEISVKIRTNVDGVDTLEIVDILNSYDIDYLHVDATLPGVEHADYDMINRISNHTNIHIIGNNNVKTRQDYEKMIDSGASSVSVARAALEDKVDEIFI